MARHIKKPVSTASVSTDSQRRAALNLMEDAVQARKTAEKLNEELRESEARFRDLADNIPQLAWIAEAGTSGEVNWFNRNWLDYTGATLKEMNGQGWQKVHHPDHAGRVIPKFAEHVKAGLDWEDTFPLRGKDGHYRWFLSRMKVIRDTSGKAVWIFGTNTDITEQRELAERLAKTAVESVEADHRKDEFLATLAHELRGPLAPLANALAIIQHANSAGNEAVTEAQGIAQRQVAHMVRLIDDLLDASRISRGKLILRRKHVELATVVNQAAEACRSSMAQAKHELTVTLPPEPIVLNADPARLTQVFSNLLSNACKYTEPGGRIALTVERHGDEAIIRVKDTGIGIAADKIGDIFEMFSQVDHALERSQGGLGIGLSLVRRLTKMHGGTVAAHSAGLGKGSEFTVRLPVLEEARMPAPAARHPGAKHAAPATKHSILVVDDNRDSAMSLAMMLKHDGHKTQTAYDGAEALAVAEKFAPHVVLMDLGMPKLNGYEAARKIREQPWGKNMVLVALTGWGQDEDRRKSIEAGFDAHLVKPVDQALLTKLLAGLPAGGA